MIKYRAEIREIQKQFERVLEYSQSISEVKSEKYIRTWFSKKKDIIKKLGGFIYEVPEPVTIELSHNIKANKIADFCNWIVRKYNLFALEEFVINNSDGFFDNVVIDSPNKEVPKGMKLLKAFKFFIEDKDVLNDVQSHASMIIQENKITGTLCFSVHPLDFLSSSENTHNWRSCHSLDGEYRAGNLSYMVDDCTVMCYLRSDDKCKLPNFPEDVPWNNKKWRMLLHFSDSKQMVFAGRPYPHALDGIMDIVKKQIQELKLLTIPQHWWYDIGLTPWSNTYITEFPAIGENYQPITLTHKYVLTPHSGLKKLESMIKNGEHSCHYNDILYSSCYTPYYMFVTYGGTYPEMMGPNPHFEIGGETFCIHCGKGHISSGDDTFLCYHCYEELGYDDDRYICSSCGSARDYMDGTYVEDEFLCWSCFDRDASSCDECGDHYYLENLIYVEEEGRHLCKYCYEQLKESEE